MITDYILGLAAFLAGIAAAVNNKELFLLPGSRKSLFSAGKLISHALTGGAAGFLGFHLKIMGIPGAFIILTLVLVMFISSFSAPGFIPRMIIQRNRKDSNRNALCKGLFSVWAPSSSLHIILCYAVVRGYYISGMIILSAFALGTLIIRWIRPVPSAAPSGTVSKVIFFVILSLFTGTALSYGLLYSGITRWDVFRGLKNVYAVTEFNDKQFIYNDKEEADLVIKPSLPLSWTIKTDTEKHLYIPAFKYKSGVFSKSRSLKFQTEKEGIVFFTNSYGRFNGTIYVTKDISLINQYKSVYTQGIADINPEAEITPLVDSFPNIPLEEVNKAEIRDNWQYATIEVTEDGYFPSIIILKRKIPARITFKSSSLNEKNYRIVIPSYGKKQELSETDPFILEFLPEVDFAYYSWKEDFGGYFILTEDLDSMNSDKARRQVNMLNKLMNR